jgi:hypothetical protein
MEPKGKLLDQMRQVIRLKHMSIRTEELRDREHFGSSR